MAKRKLANCIAAVIRRDNGMSYEGVLQIYHLNPYEFHGAVRDIDLLMGCADAIQRVSLEAIVSNPSRKQELFRMSKWYLEEQYDKISGKIAGETQTCFYPGTLMHPSNVQVIVYYILCSNNPSLASDERAEVVEASMTLPHNLNRYFKEIGLSGVMYNGHGEGKRNSPLAVLEFFDLAYQEETSDSSLFDLSEPIHLHRWGDHCRAPRYYWEDYENVCETVYHILTETYPVLDSCDRQSVVECINNLPSPLSEHFRSIGLCGLMVRAFEKKRKNSPLAVLEVFDICYIRKTGDESLFDRTQDYCLEFDDSNRFVRRADL